MATIKTDIIRTKSIQLTLNEKEAKTVLDALVLFPYAQASINKSEVDALASILKDALRA